MTPKEISRLEKSFNEVILSAELTKIKAQQALAMLAGSGKPAGTRKGKVDTQDLIIKRRNKLFQNAIKN